MQATSVQMFGINSFHVVVNHNANCLVQLSRVFKIDTFEFPIKVGVVDEVSGQAEMSREDRNVVRKWGDS